ncbi:MAG: SpoIIE family protein phosphatase [Oceanospirillaceae bacterium]
MALINIGELECFVAERALETVNGDAVFIKDEGEYLFICIFDGAGHGEGAHRIARTGTDYIQKNQHLSLPSLMNGLHKELQGTHGAVAIIGKLNIKTRKLYYVGIGNIFLRVFGYQSKREITQGGVIGYQIRTPKEKCISIKKGDILVFHTDGISSRFNETDYPNIFLDDAEKISNTLLDTFGKNNDDATCAVIRYTEK